MSSRICERRLDRGDWVQKDCKEKRWLADGNDWEDDKEEMEKQEMWEIVFHVSMGGLKESSKSTWKEVCRGGKYAVEGSMPWKGVCRGWKERALSPSHHSKNTTSSDSRQNVEENIERPGYESSNRKFEAFTNFNHSWNLIWWSVFRRDFCRFSKPLNSQRDTNTPNNTRRSFESDFFICVICIWSSLIFFKLSDRFQRLFPGRQKWLFYLGLSHYPAYTYHDVFNNSRF
jgi:hypothetical protein